MDELDKSVIDWHITQYYIHDYRLYHTINGYHLYDSKDERQRLLNTQEYHALQYLELTCNDDLLLHLGLPTETYT